MVRLSEQNVGCGHSCSWLVEGFGTRVAPADRDAEKASVVQRK